jgi:hypothetical protein
MIANKTHELKSNRGIWKRTAIGASVLAILLAIIAIPPAYAQTFTLLHEFRGGLDGVVPSGGVILDATGNLYGVTQTMEACFWTLQATSTALQATAGPRKVDDALTVAGRCSK